jgi:L-seryl-tRNA(Ser) seleniumtransferase
LPAVDVVVGIYQRTAATNYPHHLLVRGAQEIVESLRQQILAAAGEQQLAGLAVTPEEVAVRLDNWLQTLAGPALRRVINATGTILHTNLGRAALAPAARQAVQNATGYCNLEQDLREGKRGSRHDLVEKLLLCLTGAEAACVVNNNAAAVLLCLNTLAAGRKVIVSRGELVEIGGNFRIPEVMKASGACLVEVGTTNKTRLSDYSEAIDNETALLLKVHTSNYRIIGFTSVVEIAELANLSAKSGVPLMEDLGSGQLVDLGPYGLGGEPLVAERVAAGVDVLTMSGDKLLGGPQAGLILGRRELVARIRKNQLMRALRPDKLTLAALEATLRIYLSGDPLREIPVLAMLTVPPETLRRRAERLAETVRRSSAGKLAAGVREERSFIGGGAMPEARLPTFVVTIPLRGEAGTEWLRRLRQGSPPLLGRVQDGTLLLDLRTVAEDEEEEVVRCLLT